MGDRGGRSFGVRKRGWVPASARTTGGGTVNLPRLHGGRLCAGKRVSGGWIPAFRRNDERERGLLADDGRFANRPCGGECCRARGSPPIPRLHEGRLNLPPSRGKGLVGAERAISIVMTCFTKGDGLPPSREKREVGWATGGTLLRGTEEGMGPRIREDNGRVGGGWATTGDAPTGDGRGDGSPHPRGQRRGGGRVRGGASCR